LGKILIILSGANLFGLSLFTAMDKLLPYDNIFLRRKDEIISPNPSLKKRGNEEREIRNK
jgi:hypothetical protein